MYFDSQHVNYITRSNVYWSYKGKLSRAPCPYTVYNIDIDDQSETFQLAVRQGAWKLIWGQTKEFKPNKKEEPELLLFNLEQGCRAVSHYNVAGGIGLYGRCLHTKHSELKYYD